MRIIYAIVVLFAVTLAHAGDTAIVPNPPVAATAASSAQSCAENTAGGAAAGQLAQGGACCKANKGVCGCRAGKIVCCDKSFAANCPCNRDDPLTTL